MGACGKYGVIRHANQLISANCRSAAIALPDSLKYTTRDGKIARSETQTGFGIRKSRRQAWDCSQKKFGASEDTPPLPSLKSLFALVALRASSASSAPSAPVGSFSPQQLVCSGGVDKAIIVDNTLGSGPADPPPCLGPPLPRPVPPFNPPSHVPVPPPVFPKRLPPRIVKRDGILLRFPAHQPGPVGFGDVPTTGLPSQAFS